MSTSKKNTVSPIREGCEKVLSDFRNRIADITELNMDHIPRARIMLSLTHYCMLELKFLINGHPFTNQAEEIWFFKEVKPQLMANLIFEQRMAQIVVNVPQGTMAAKLSYLEEEMRYVRKELDRDKFYYEYYRYNLDEIDHLGFVRGGEIPFPVLTEVNVPGSDFSTPLDYLYAKFHAFEDIMTLLEVMITELLKPIDIETELKTIQDKGLKWTGDSINLVELAYAIWLTGQMNNGNANISEIIRWMEDHFQVKIGRAHRRWSEISQRKRLSTTKYLDTCREAIYKRLDEENALK